MHSPSNCSAAPRSSVDLALQGKADLEFSFAFQPIVDATTRKVISFEALVRGTRGESSTDVFARVPRDELYSFDQACRLKAIRLAVHLNLQSMLNLNFLPNSVQRSSTYLYATLEAARAASFAVERLVFEITEMECHQPREGMEGVFGRCAALGFQTAIDDFGTGFSGLRRLAEYQPDFVKLDRHLIVDIHLHHIKQAIVAGICDMCSQLSIIPVAEGVENAAEYRWLRQAGIRIFQGYYFARPAFEALSEVQQGVF